jgi:preprotein translocase subunit SecG
MSSGRIAQHRNYGELMRQHEHDVKFKRIFKVFTYFLVILFIVILLVIVMRWEKRSSKKVSTHTIEYFSVPPVT